MAARSDRFEKLITPVIDTLQTLPSFCFIIPVVMLFRVGDVTAMIATVAFAVVPAIRYTNHGIRQVPPALIEAAKVSGCTKRQTFLRVQLPLALPEIMLGINQTILMALAMIIICAMIGTRDLGQEVFIALSKADSGRGIVGGPGDCLHRHRRRPAAWGVERQGAGAAGVVRWGAAQFPVALIGELVVEPRGRLAPACCISSQSYVVCGFRRSQHPKRPRGSTGFHEGYSVSAVCGLAYSAAASFTWR